MTAAQLTAPAHWIGENALCRQPKCWVYLDTEAVIEDDGTSEIQSWRLAVTAHDHRRGSYDDWREPEWAVHENPRALWEWVDSRARVGERMVVVAHNLAYDLRIGDVFTHLPKLGWRLDRIRLDAQQSQCRWRNGRRTIQMIDSTSWWPVGLDVIAAELHLEKPPLPDNDGDDAAWVARCTADVNVLRTAWRRLLGWLHDDDIGNWQPTGAGQAWSAWRHKHMSDKVLVGDDAALREKERTAVWCGRAEAWRHGKHVRGPYTEWDYELSYLTVMRDCGVPVRPISPAPFSTVESVEYYAQRACVLATVNVTTDVPLVPVQGPHGILWPVGEFTTTLWDPELKMLFASDAKVEIVDTMVYRRRPALAEFARWLWPLCDDDYALVDPIVHRTAKHWSRALVGRFGVRYSEWEEFGATRQNEVGLQNVSDMRDGTVWRMLSVGDRCLRESQLLEGENAVPSILGWVMSETRARLWAAIVAAGTNNVLHCDTDGLLVNAKGNDALIAAALPGLRVKSEWERAEVFGPRQTVLGGRLKAPGVPRRARRVGPNTWNGETWNWLSSSLREGSADRVRVQRRTIHLRGTDRRRRHLAHGRTAPFDFGEL